MKITYEILSYLIDHPDASDTLEGIIHWWLLEQKIKSQMEAVKKALAELVTKGLVIEYQGADSQIHYCINKNNYEKILAFFEQRPDDKKEYD